MISTHNVYKSFPCDEYLMYVIAMQKCTKIFFKLITMATAISALENMKIPSSKKTFSMWHNNLVVFGNRI